MRLLAIMVGYAALSWAQAFWVWLAAVFVVWFAMRWLSNIEGGPDR